MRSRILRVVITIVATAAFMGSAAQTASAASVAQSAGVSSRVAAFPSPIYDCEAASPVLRYGSTGYCVKVMQGTLNVLYGTGLAEDGVYGAATTSAVRQFQARYGLVVDGICGAKTWAQLSGAFYNMVHGWPY